MIKQYSQAAVIFACIALGFMTAEGLSAAPQRSSVPNPENDRHEETASDPSLVEMVKTIRLAVATIVSFDGADDPVGQGSGFFINNKGHLITNQHVIQGAQSATVKTADGTVYPAVGVLAADPNSDIVKLLVDTEGGQTPYITAVDIIPSVAEDIVIVGSPFGLESTVSRGIVSAIRRIPNFGNILQVSAPISSGSSGSPVLNMKGQVIGVATFMLTEGQALNFAVPSERILNLRDDPEVTPFPRYSELTERRRTENVQRRRAIQKNELLRKAEEGDPEAMYELGKIYRVGRGDIVRDHPKALKLLRRSAEAGNSKAMLQLALVDENEIEAFRWLNNAAEVGSGGAMLTLALLYWEGHEEIVADKEQSQQWLKKALTTLYIDANKGDAEAMQTLSQLYEKGLVGLSKNADKAVEWSRKAKDAFEKEALEGDPEAMFQLAEMYGEVRGVEVDRAKQMFWYRKAAEAGDPRGMYELAMKYHSGAFVPQDLSRALQWYLKAVKITQEVHTMISIGNLYEDDNSITDNTALAIVWYKKAFKASPSTEGRWASASAYWIANIYSKGEGIPKDSVEAFKWYAVAAEQGHAHAMLALGSAYYYGEGVEQDYHKAYRWTSTAAEHKWPSDAKLFLAILYHEGRGIERDDAKASDLLKEARESSSPETLYDYVRRCNEGRNAIRNVSEIIGLYRMAADRGDSEAMLALGMTYAHVLQDTEEAVQWFNKAAEAGDSAAMDFLGFAYEKGDGVAKDFLKSMAWYSKSAEAGDMRGMANLGRAYYKTEDFDNAFKWFNKAAEQGESEAMRMLGVLYSEGQGVLQDEQKAVEWWQKAADAGSTIVMLLLGDAYQNGKGVIQDYQKAFKWYEQLADTGDSNGMFCLGFMHSNGRGVAVDNIKAVEWWRKGAEKEHTGCMFNLGWAYLNGKGVQRDRGQAVRWYQRVARLGHEQAKKVLVELGEIW